MLSRLVSEEWPPDDASDEPIFVDRDGETFRHVLNYLRYGRVALPCNVSTDSFLTDMDFCSIHVAEGSVTRDQHPTMMNCLNAIDKVDRLVGKNLNETRAAQDTLRADVKKIEKKLEDQEETLSDIGRWSRNISRCVLNK